MTLSEEKLKQRVVDNIRTDFSRLHVDQTVGDALVAVRSQPVQERIVYFYVFDDADRLVGVLPTRRLLLNQPDAKVADIMVRNLITIPHTATVAEACEYFVLHRLLAFPVVDDAGRVLGIVDVQLYTSEISDLDRAQRQDQLFQLIGVHLAAAEQASPVLAFRSRFPWLLCNIGGGILAAFLSGIFEEELQRVVALALFIPVVLALAESVSIQSVSLALQMLEGNPPTVAALWMKLRRELITGAMLGLASAVLVSLVAVGWLWNWRVAACLLMGILTGVTCASLLGVAIPNVLHLLRRNPQVAAGPIALATADMLTLLVYFSSARLLI